MPRALHWDLRLERDGVLVSWAVPKGIPPTPEQNHLAVQTEDHPLAVPRHSRATSRRASTAAARCSVWDTGTYEMHKFDDERSDGDAARRTRVDGSYVLFKTGGKNWMIHRMDPPQDPGRHAMPRDIEPMLATLVAHAPRGDGWAWELKWDGVRALGYVEGGRIRLFSRNGNDVTRRYPELRRARRRLRCARRRPRR